MTVSTGLGKLQGVLACTIVAGFFFVLGYVVYASQTDFTLRDLRLQLVTALQVAFGGVIGYFFATSARNQQTDALLASSVPTMTDPTRVTTTTEATNETPATARNP